MKKVLLLAPDFNDYTKMFSRSIRKCGYRVRSISFDPYDWATALLKKLHVSQESLIDYRVKRFNKYIVEKFKEYKPDYVIVIRGDFILRETLSRFKKVRLAIWLYDSVTRYPRTMDNWDLYDCHYVFEKSDIELLNKKSLNACFLPLGYDQRLYFPVDNEKQDIDISFVGAMYGNRKELLEKIANKYRDKKIRFYGIYSQKRNVLSYLRFICSSKKDSFMNKTISHDDARDLYSRTRININILHEQSQYGWNARLNEILGSGGFELVTCNPLIEKKYSGMLDTFKDEDELFSIIDYYLKHDTERRLIGENAYKYVKDKETYDCRFRQIMDDLSSINKR